MKSYFFLIALLFAAVLTRAQSAERNLYFNQKEIDRITRGNRETAMPLLPLSSPEGIQSLRAVSANISTADSLLPVLAQRMLLCVTDSATGGVGIAAPQVGVNRNLIWVQRYDREQMPFALFVNPRILWKSELSRKGAEGDLSFPGRAEVYRSYVIQVTYQTLEGAQKTEIIEGFTAVIVQHEIDHLHGILLTDRASEQAEPPYTPAELHIPLYIRQIPQR